MKVEEHKAALEKKYQSGVEILEITQKPAFRELLVQIGEKIESIKDNALDAKSYEILSEYRGEIRGLKYLQTALDAFVNKAKSAKRTL